MFYFLISVYSERRKMVQRNVQGITFKCRKYVETG